jgi:DNA end-binding protein Ku
VPRALWTGSVAFGLVSVPVRMTSAVSDHALHFNYLHEPDGSRIGYEKVCKAEGKPVPDDEIVKAFEIEKDEWVTMSDEDFEAAAVEQGARTVDIRAFVPQDEIDPIYFERTYYLEPQEGAEKVYALLARALEESGLVAVAKIVMRDRQHLACLRVRDGVLLLERMHFADEIRPAEDLAPEGVRVAKQELEMARTLIEQFTGSFEPERFRDTYRDTLCEIIRAKQRGDTVRPPEAAKAAEEPTDLMAALRASVEAAAGRRAGGKASNGKRLEGLSKDELYELAREADVPGRSDMSKDELLEALRAAA